MTEDVKKRALRLEMRESDMEGDEGTGEQEPLPAELIGYVTVVEANQYVSQNYMLEDEARTRWESLDDDSKKALLRKSLQSIELLPFVGRKTGGTEQKLQFPRCPSTEVPWQVKAAQVENALSKSDNETDEDTKFYERLWTWGIQSYTLGKLSEKVSTGGFGGGILGALGTAQETGITSASAARLLKPFLMGGYGIV